MEHRSPTTDAFEEWRNKATWYTHETTFMRFVRVVGRFIIRLLVHIECTGLDHIPAGPCIVAPNHINDFDTLAIGYCLPRFPFFMAKRELYQNPIFGLVLRWLGTFPVSRGERDTWALEQAGRVLEGGQILCMFPEGTRSGRQARLGRGKPGAVKLGLAHQVPVIPTAIIGTQNIFSSLKRPKVVIQLGQPLDVGAMAGPPPHSHAKFQEMTTILMKQIAAMLPPDQRGVYASAPPDMDPVA